MRINHEGLGRPQVDLLYCHMSHMYLLYTCRLEGQEQFLKIVTDVNLQLTSKGLLPSVNGFHTYTTREQFNGFTSVKSAMECLKTADFFLKYYHYEYRVDVLVFKVNFQHHP